MDDIKFLTAGDEAVVVEFGKTIDEAVNRRVRALAEALRSEPVEGVTDTIPTFRSLMVCFDPKRTGREKVSAALRERCGRLSAAEGGGKTVIEIPVCYGARFGVDLKDVAEHTGLLYDEVIALHSGRDYRIYMLGFLPGFSYLGGMDERLVTPRLPNPRVKIPMGSVGIGGEQTGIYPLDSPGGWRLIGATPVRAYDVNREKPILYEAGEYLRFVPVSLFDYYDIRRMVERGEYYCRVTEDGAERAGRCAGVPEEKSGKIIADMRGGRDAKQDRAGGDMSGAAGKKDRAAGDISGAAGKQDRANGDMSGNSGEKDGSTAAINAAENAERYAAQKAAETRAALKILTPGLLTTVQDYGRIGYQKYGFSVSGAMDRASYAYANALVGNPDGAAALECTMLGPSFEVQADMAIAVTGADMQPVKNGQPMPMNKAVKVKRGDVIALGTARTGCRAYVAAAGGIAVAPVMGSRSTHMKCRIGGYQGRKLAAGDVLPVGSARTDDSPADTVYGAHGGSAGRQLSESSRVKAADTEGRKKLKTLSELRAASLAAVNAGTQAAVPLRVISGPQEEYFAGAGEQTFFSEVYHLTENCDRMGYKLDGASVASAAGVDIVSDGIAFGAVQIPPNGKPIIMLADRQTTGGYAKIGTVAAEDIPKLVQLRPGAAVRFVKA